MSWSACAREFMLAQHVSSVWEDLVRGAIHRLPIGGHAYTGAAPWWGRGSDGERLELDVVAARAGGHAVVGEVKVRASARDVPRLLSALERKAARCPALDGMRVTCVLFVLHGPKSARVFGAADVLAAYRE